MLLNNNYSAKGQNDGENMQLHEAEKTKIKKSM